MSVGNYDVWLNALTEGRCSEAYLSRVLTGSGNRGIIEVLTKIP